MLIQHPAGSGWMKNDPKKLQSMLVGYPSELMTSQSTVI